MDSNILQTIGFCSAGIAVAAVGAVVVVARLVTGSLLKREIDDEFQRPCR
jgi:hypothetical protein